MTQVPRAGGLDASLAPLRSPYEFISRRRRRLGRDAFETRLLLQPAVCMTGAEAAREFYADNRFTRRRALPPTALTLLQDKGSAAVLDGGRIGTARRCSPIDRPRLLRRAARADGQRVAVGRRALAAGHKGRPAPRRAGGALPCGWAGVPLPESHVRARTSELAAMIDGAGAIGPREWPGQLLGQRCERSLRAAIEHIRRGDLRVPETSPAHVIAWHG